MNETGGFYRYVGVQGVIAILMIVNLLVAPYFSVVVPDWYENLMFVVLGFYFSKNGTDLGTVVVNKLRKKE